MTLETIGRYTGYSYAYPHKLAYRELSPAVPLAQAWAAERKDALFLYVHVPFCEMRCGFCNLFAQSRPRAEVVQGWLDALQREAHVVRDALGAATFARMAIGGGTPTYLGRGELERLFAIADLMGADASTASVETSPGTADALTLAYLAARGTQRVSIGIQSFDDRELRAVGRPERADALAAVERLRDAGFPIVNIDLIYGIQGQTVATFLDSLRTALTQQPEELYLYPLYVRPQTGISRRGSPDDEHRLALYRAGRDFLLEAGYDQLSMRAFRRHGVSCEAGLSYCCQDDGMVGLGCGARSYTRALHYSSRYAVTASGVRDIIGEYAATSDEDFATASWGIRVGEAEQRRRWTIKSLLRAEGMSLTEYRERFASDALQDFPALGELVERRLATLDTASLRLVPAGIELSDAIGPWLYSDEIAARMA